MRNRKFGAGLAAVLVIGAAGMAGAGPFEKDATSKERGDFVGRAPARRNATTRAYSYNPSSGAEQPTPAAATAPTANSPRESAPNELNEQQQPAAKATRSYSYQSPGNTVTPRSATRARPDSRYLHAERKALGEY
ncbi:MAG TPA: hypothetical protein VHV08_09260 [Pirellulales bacterium]|nr:hypothetical protein [Pirellulales bacterium]